MQIGLIILRKNIVSYLEHNYVWRNTHNSAFSTTNDSHDKDKVFPDGECLHATIKYTDHFI